jgi:hypothetical protein
MNDMIDLAKVTILNSVDVRDWPITTTIDRIDVQPNNVRLAFSKQQGADAWPPQPFGDPKDGGNVQYTVWLLLEIDGQWFGSGFIDMWQGRDGVGDSISDFPANWYYDAHRWAPMTGHHILPGETIGFMVTAGDARNGGSSSVHERSNIVTIVAPSGDVGDFTFASAAPAPPPSPPAPIGGDELAQLEQSIEDVVQALDEMLVNVKAVSAKLAAAAAAGVKVPA